MQVPAVRLNSSCFIYLLRVILCHSLFQTTDRLASHLQNHLPREAKAKIQNIAIEYVKCQVRVVCIIKIKRFKGTGYDTPLSM